MLVMKFGGTSVGSAARIKSVCDIIKSAPSNPVVVVSAVAGVTNSLIALAHKAQRQRQVAFKEIQAMHAAILRDLGHDAGLLDAEFTELAALCKKAGKVDKKTLDHFVSFGERLCAPIVAATLTRIGIKAKAFAAWDIGMITDEHFGGAEPLPSSSALIRKKIAALSVVPVITGYIGKTKKGKITTLGRGGSDYTAAIVGAALKAKAIQIWKEVDGIMSTDPRLVSAAKVLPELAFEEASELAYFGAKVLHPKTILPAMTAGVPVQVLNTFSPNGKGTTIVSNFAARREMSHSIEALTFKKNIMLIHVLSPEFFDGSGLMARIFNIFDRCNTSIDLITTSVASVSLTIDNDEHLKELTRELSKLGNVVIERDKAIICAVGGSLNAAGVAGRMFTVLGERRIPVELISQASSGYSMTFVVDTKDAENTIKILHKEYIE